MAISFGHGELQGELVRILYEIDGRLEALEAPKHKSADAEALSGFDARLTAIEEHLSAKEATAEETKG